MLSAFISWRSYSEVGSSMVLGATNHTRRAEYTIGASWRAHLSNQSLTTGLHGTLQTYWGPRFSGHQTCPRNNDTQVYRPLWGPIIFLILYLFIISLIKVRSGARWRQKMTQITPLPAQPEGEWEHGLAEPVVPAPGARPLA